MKSISKKTSIYDTYYSFDTLDIDHLPIPLSVGTRKELEKLFTWFKNKLKIDVIYCKNIFEGLRASPYNKTSILFVDKQHRPATTIAFSFARYVDDVVDEARLYLQDSTENTLQLLQDERILSREKNFSNHPVINAMRRVVNEYDIPEVLIENFLTAMKQDVIGNHIKTYAQLEQYMYNASSVWAIIMTHILCPGDEKTREVAIYIGYAMHLTNILKDIKKDVDLGMIYIPDELFDKFGVDKSCFQKQQHTQEWKNLVKHIIVQARKYYRIIESKLDRVHPNVRTVALVSIEIYRLFLEEIEKMIMMYLKKCLMFLRTKK